LSLLRLLPCVVLQVRIHSRPKKTVPAIDTVPTETANWCWTVMGDLLVFNARQAYETTTHNNRSYAVVGFYQISPSTSQPFTTQINESAQQLTEKL
jgi:hypothetical protein